MLILGLYFGGHLNYLRPWEEYEPTETSAIFQQNQTATSSAYFEICGQPVSLEFYMTLSFVTAIVAIMALVLLLRLGIFHAYISYVGITTYEYIRIANLNQADPKNDHQDQSSNKCRENDSKKNKNQVDVEKPL